MLESFFRKNIFSSFFKIDLNAVELATAEDSVKNKYIKGASMAIFYGVVSLPTLLFSDTTILTSVLIPITMVSGTAWFAVSLINIRKKFENFGNELTLDLYRSFVTSLIFLSLMSLIALNPVIFADIIAWGKAIPSLVFVSGVIGTTIVIKMIYDVFLGATKYDMNDSMLTGQNEAAEKYFKKSLSLLNSCATHLKESNISFAAVGYYIGLAFYEVFNYVIQTKGKSDQILFLIKDSTDFKNNPSDNCKKVIDKCIYFVEQCLILITNVQDEKTKKSISSIKSELNSIQTNIKEPMDVTNIRLATILEELEDMLVGQGEALFLRRIEIERKFLVTTVPNLKNYKSEHILQGYLSTDKNNEIRVRQKGEEYFKTVKKIYESGYREEVEEYITKDEFDKAWPKTKGKQVKKTRYYIPYQNQTIELDVYDNNDLVTAEVEFSQESEVEKFSPPSWFGADVTNDPKYKNANLAS